MASNAQGYDLGVTTYSRDGKIMQIDYAQRCVDNAPTVLAITCKDGVIFATQKIKINSLLVSGTNKRAYAVTKNHGCCFTGMLPDGRVVMKRARDEASHYEDTYGTQISGQLLAERIGHYLHQFTQYGGYRPLGITILIGHCTEKSKSLWSVDPSGQVTKWKGIAIGKGRQLANTEIEKLYDGEQLSCEEALFHCAKILHKVHDDKQFDLEMVWMCESSHWQYESVPQEKIDLVSAQAKDAIAEDEE